jgi:hypothetical protein
VVKINPHRAIYRSNMVKIRPLITSTSDDPR